ncbi:4-coumarate-CoA ligase [Cadophora sp. DSE1049]|nr:4-coumarate-CoA ligase [Cadophora sp. DSE1049]
MPFASPYSQLACKVTNLLDYAFPTDGTPSDEPIWIDSQDTTKSLSPKQALNWIKRWSFGLESRGLKPGDVVMFYTPNHIFIPPAYYGVIVAGFIFSAANPAYTIAEVAHQMRILEPKTLLVHTNLLKSALEAAAKVGIPESRLLQFSDEEVPTHEGVFDWRTMLGTSAQGKSYRWSRFTPEQAKTTIATINFSSGTTGLPKGVCISHFNLIANVEQSIALWYTKSPRPERFIGVLPLYHAFGQTCVLSMALKLLVPVYVMKAFQYDAFLETIQNYRITTLHVSPSILTMMSKRPETERYDLSSLETILSSAAPLSRQLQNECSDRLNVDIIQAWGMTEATCGATMVPRGVNDDTGSVGALFPSTECKLLDDDGSSVLKLGKPGEIYIRGPQVCLGYWKNEQATKKTIDQDGWLKTGDIMICDQRGFLKVVDRKKELIKVNGFQVASAELETVLLENEQIVDAAVVGVVLDGEELPRAYCEIREQPKGRIKPEDVQEWIKTRMSKHKWLSGGVVFVDQVPRLGSGKIQRKVVQEWAKRDAAKMKSHEIARPRI